MHSLFIPTAPQPTIHPEELWLPTNLIKIQALLEKEHLIKTVYISTRTKAKMKENEGHLPSMQTHLAFCSGLSNEISPHLWKRESHIQN